MSNKVLENRLRRMAERQGMKFEKIRRIDPKAIDYGHFRITDAAGNLVKFNGIEYGTADEIEAFLTR